MSFQAAIVVCVVAQSQLFAETTKIDPSKLSCASFTSQLEHKREFFCMVDALEMKMTAVREWHGKGVAVTVVGGCKDIGEGL